MKYLSLNNEMWIVMEADENTLYHPSERNRACVQGEEE